LAIVGGSEITMLDKGPRVNAEGEETETTETKQKPEKKKQIS